MPERKRFFTIDVFPNGQVHSSCVESLYIESEHSRLGIDRIKGAEINDSREPEFLPAESGSQP